jgi:hypothetical protein
MPKTTGTVFDGLSRVSASACGAAQTTAATCSPRQPLSTATVVAAASTRPAKATPSGVRSPWIAIATGARIAPSSPSEASVSEFQRQAITAPTVAIAAAATTAAEDGIRS